MTDLNQSSRTNRVFVTVAVAVLVVVLAVVAGVVWRSVRDESAAPSDLGAATAAPTTKSAEQEAADAALAAYNGFREADVAASAAGDATYPDLAKYAVDPALAQVKYDVYQLSREDLVTKGRPTWSPRVVATFVTTTPKTVQIADCFDVTNWQVVNKNSGQVVNAPGQALRYVIAAEAFQANDGRWLVRQSTADRGKSC